MLLDICPVAPTLNAYNERFNGIEVGDAGVGKVYPDHYPVYPRKVNTL